MPIPILPMFGIRNRLLSIGPKEPTTIGLRRNPKSLSSKSQHSSKASKDGESFSGGGYQQNSFSQQESKEFDSSQEEKTLLDLELLAQKIQMDG